MDPYNKLTDFVKLYFPNRELGKIHLQMLSIIEYIDIRMKYFGEDRYDAIINYHWYSEHMKNNYPDLYIDAVEVVCKTAPVPQKVKAKKSFFPVCEALNIPKEETMRTETEVTREYLLRRLDRVRNEKNNEFENLFNLHADTNPRSYKELIDWIKSDKFKLDDKRVKVIEAQTECQGFQAGWGAFDGIIWTDAEKQPDPKGYDAAYGESQKRYTAAKDAIMVYTGETALKALQDFESWMPEAGTKAN